MPRVVVRHRAPDKKEKPKGKAKPKPAKPPKPRAPYVVGERDITPERVILQPPCRCDGERPTHTTEDGDILCVSCGRSRRLKVPRNLRGRIGMDEDGNIYAADQIPDADRERLKEHFLQEIRNIRREIEHTAVVEQMAQDVMYPDRFAGIEESI